MTDLRGPTVLSLLVCAWLAASCTVSPTPVRDDKQLVEPDAPVFEKRLRDIDPNDLRLEDFWIEGVQGAPTEPIPELYFGVSARQDYGQITRELRPSRLTPDRVMAEFADFFATNPR